MALVLDSRNNVDFQKVLDVYLHDSFASSCLQFELDLCFSLSEECRQFRVEESKQSNTI